MLWFSRCRRFDSYLGRFFMRFSWGFVGVRCGDLGVFLVCVHLLSISLLGCE